MRDLNTLVQHVRHLEAPYDKAGATAEQHVNRQRPSDTRSKSPKYFALW